MNVNIFSYKKKEEKGRERQDARLLSAAFLQCWEAGIRLSRLSPTPKYTAMLLGMSITLQPAHDKSPVLREVFQFHIMHCNDFNIEGKGGAG